MSDTSDKQNDNQPFDVYANQIRVAMTIYDFTLFFGKSTLAEEGEYSTPQAIIRMSPSHAKALHFLLERFISRYEQDISPINFPEEFAKRLREGPLENESSEAEGIPALEPGRGN